MHRARRAVAAAFILIWSVAALALADVVPQAAPSATSPAVAWPTSSGLLIAEVVTGGASASDEYIELTNAGPAPVDLNGLELAYASSAGTSATKRVGWTASLLLGPGRHLLIANSAGIFAAGADAKYTAGIAATGGAVVLRPTGGTPIDAVGWGDATNAFVEGSPAAAPDAGASIERKPGGSAGNVADSNNNANDFALNAAPDPEDLAAPARPAPGATPTPTPTPTRTPTPSPVPTPVATPTPTPRPSASPSPTPVPTPTPRPTPTPTSTPSPTPTPSGSPTPVPTASPTPHPTATPTPIPSPTPTPVPTRTPIPTSTPVPTPTPTPSPTPTLTPTPSPTPTPTPSPVPSPTPTPTPSPTASTISIAEALASTGQVAVAGVVTAGPSLIDTSGRLIVIQDATAAIEVRLPATGTTAAAGLAGQRIVPGVALRVQGSIGHAYGAPRLTATAVTWLGSAAVPAPLRITTVPGSALEWRLVVATGRLDSVHRLGLSWRAELIVGTIRIPIVGLTGAQILVGRLFTDRKVTIVGIVRRAYPTAIDQRFAIEPRSFGDLSFGQPDPAHAQSGGSAGSGSDGGTSLGTPVGVGTAPDPAPVPSGSQVADLRDLRTMAGRLVAVSGIVTQVAGSFVTLDDGTATGRLMLTGAAAAYLDLIEIGDPLAADGRVKLDASGPFVFVTDANGVRQAGDPGTAASPAPASPTVDRPQPSAGAASPGPRQVGPGLGLSGGGGPGGSGPIGILQALVLIVLGALFSLAVGLPLARRSTRQAATTAPGEAPRA